MKLIFSLSLRILWISGFQDFRIFWYTQCMPEKKSEMQHLRPKQAVFVNEYIKNGGNSTQAAIAAGYSPGNAGSQGSENTKKPHISLAIQEKTQVIEQDFRERLKVQLPELVALASSMLKNLEAGRQIYRKDGSLAMTKFDAGPYFKGIELIAKLCGYLNTEGDDPADRAKKVYLLQQFFESKKI
jgi:phage terminase small subunit